MPSIEHGIHLDEAAVAVMAEHGTWLVPTLSATMGEATPDAELVEAHQASARRAAGAVRAATYDAGRLLDLDVGEISPGKQADLVLLTAESGEDPLGDVTDLSARVLAVWKGGQQVSPVGPLPLDR